MRKQPQRIHSKRRTLTLAAALSALALAGCHATEAPSHNAASGAPHGGRSDIVDTAIGAGSFNTLVAAVQAAGLVETLKGPGPFTVFAPTDAAFAKLPPGTVESLLEPRNRARLREILTYHVVAGKVTAEQVVELDSAPTVQGKSLPIRTDHSTVRVGEARVTQTDIHCTNGVIHVIDAVLIP